VFHKKKGKTRGSKLKMLDLHCPTSGYKCSLNRNFLVYAIQVHSPKKIASRLGFKWPGQRGRGGEGEGKKRGV
jgi:hypothetical protein